MKSNHFLRVSVFANLLTLVLLPEIAHAQVVTVSCSPATGGTYPSITAALNAVGQIGPRTFTVTGTCNENVSLTNAQSLTFIGAAGAKIVQPQDSNTFDIARSQNITLQNLEIAGVPGSTPFFGGAGVKISRLLGSGFGFGFGAFLVSFRPLSLFPMGERMPQSGTSAKS